MKQSNFCRPPKYWTHSCTLTLIKVTLGSKRESTPVAVCDHGEKTVVLLSPKDPPGLAFVRHFLVGSLREGVIMLSVGSRSLRVADNSESELFSLLQDSKRLARGGAGPRQCQKFP